MTTEEKYDLLIFKAVNKCKTLDELGKVILAIGKTNNGVIKGYRSGSFYNAEKMYSDLQLLRKRIKNLLILAVRLFIEEFCCLTRQYGIRQQAILLFESGEQ